MTAINIALCIGGQTIDLRIPRDVTVARLRVLISDGLATRGILLPKDFSLQSPSKALRLDDDVFVRDYPLADGDLIDAAFETDAGYDVEVSRY